MRNEAETGQEPRQTPVKEITSKTSLSPHTEGRVSVCAMGTRDKSASAYLEVGRRLPRGGSLLNMAQEHLGSLMHVPLCQSPGG